MYPYLETSLAISKAAVPARSGSSVDGFTIKGIVKEQIYVGSVLKTIVMLPNGNEIRMERLSGEQLPERGTVYLYWEPEDARVIHSLSDVFFDAVENMKLA